MLDGKPMCRDFLLRIAFYPTLVRARLRRVTFHALRHSCASAMIAAGAPVTEVQHRLGHANPAITLQIYTHFVRHSESDAADRLANDVLSGGFRRIPLGNPERSVHLPTIQGIPTVDHIDLAG
jgi:integrase